MTRRLLLSAVLPTQFACGLDSGQLMPRFRARALSGKTFDNASVKGKPVLLQFWTTWCGYCRREQPVVDRLTREFAGELVVLAVNVGESRAKVEHYLSENPRACNIVLMSDTNLAAIFPTQGFPKYVAINSEGRIKGNQDGAGGMLALRDLLAGAGLRGKEPE